MSVINTELNFHTKQCTGQVNRWMPFVWQLSKALEGLSANRTVAFKMTTQASAVGE